MIDASENLVDLTGVLEARSRLTDENQRELAGLSPLERLQQLKAWGDLAKLRRGVASKVGLLGTAVTSLRPSESERAEAAERLVNRWLQKWKLHDPKLREAAERIARCEGRSRAEIRKQALRTALFLALADAREPQATQIGRDRAMSLGSKIVLLQQKDLEHLARDGLNDELVRKLTAAPAGLHVFPPYRLLSPIHAALSGFDLEAIRPTELRLPLFYHWVRRRAFLHAEEWLWQEAGFDSVQPHEDWERVEEQDSASEPTSRQVTELDLLEALDRDDPDPLQRIGAQQELAELLEIATPAEHEIVELLDFYHVEEGMPKAEAIKTVASDRGVKVNTVHKTLSRLVNKMED